jgi:spore coat protein H
MKGMRMLKGVHYNVCFLPRQSLRKVCPFGVLALVSLWMLGARCRDDGTQIPTGCEDMVDTTLATADAKALFDSAVVPTFDLYLPPGEWTKLQINARDETYIPANVCYEGRSIGEVGLRFKGNVGSLGICFNDQDELICPRLDMKLKFNKYDKDLRFHGLKRLNFNVATGDDTYMKEALTYDVYREMGIVTPRTGWANVRVNGKSQGLYLLVEQVDGRFTEDRWPEDPNGNVYKEMWPVIFRSNASVTPDSETVVAHLKTNEDEANVSGFLSLSEQIMTASDADLRDTLDRIMGMDYLVRYMAVDEVTTNVDGVTAWYKDLNSETAMNHNFYIYEKSDGKLVLIPWDLDNTLHTKTGFFGEVPGWQTVPTDCSLEYATWNGSNTVIAPGCDRILQTVAKEEAHYAAVVQQVLNGPFSGKTLDAKIDAYATRIRQAAAEDPLGPGKEGFEKAIDRLKKTIPVLHRRVECLTEESALPLQIYVGAVTDMEAFTACSLQNGPLSFFSANTFATDRINTTNPLSGTQSLRVVFEYAREQTEWGNALFYELPLEEEFTDVSGLNGMKMSLRADQSRSIRLFLVGKAATDIGYTGTGWGWDVVVGPEAATLKVKFSQATFTEWAQSEPPQSLQEVLAGMSGIMFWPMCEGYNSGGFLPQGQVDSGFIDIDDVSFF